MDGRQEKIDSAPLMQTFIHPFSGLPTKRIQNMIVFNIHHTLFPKDGNFWGSIIDGCEKKILFSMAHIIDRKDIGTRFTNGAGQLEPLYYKEGEPKVVVCQEVLRTESRQILDEFGQVKGREPGEFRGLRIWLLSLDPSFSFAKGLEEMINENQRKYLPSKEQSTNTTDSIPKRRGYKKVVDEPFSHETIRNNDYLTTHIWSVYLRDTQFYGEGTIDQLHNNSKISDENNPLNPYRILTPQRAMTLHVDGVCEAQRNIDSYFNSLDGVSGTTFKGVFPIPEDTYRIMGQHFNPVTLRESPLPHLLTKEIGANVDTLKKRQTSLAKLERQMNSIDPEDEQGVNKLQEEMEVIRMDITRIEDLIGGITDKFRKTAEKTEPFLLGTGIQDELKSRNEFMRIRDTNKVKLDEIAKKYPLDSTEYENAMSQFTKTALIEFWQVFLYSKDVTPSVKSARSWYMKLPIEERWHENNMAVKNLSPFGNTIVRMMTELDRVFKVETNFQIVMLSIFVMYCALRYSWALRPNILLNGDGASGKSWILDLLEEIAVPGATMNITHFTQHAMTGSVDASDVLFIVHELPLEKFGIDSRTGRDMAADPYLKNVLTKQMNVTVTQDLDRNDRTPRTYVSRAMCGFAIATNDTLPGGHNPMMQRFLKHQMTKNKKRDEDMVSMENEYIQNDRHRETILHGVRLSHFYIMVIEKAIESNALGADVDTNVAKYVSKSVFKEMKENGVPVPERRQEDMYRDICRVVTILYSIQMNFFSELGRSIRQDPQGNPRDFHPLSLMEIRKWLVCTQEIAVFVLTLMEPIFTPHIRASVVNVIGYNLNRFPYQIGTTEFRKLPASSLSKTNEDRRYLEICGTSLAVIAAKVQRHIPNPPSVTEILGAFQQLQYEFVDSEHYDFFPVAEPLAEGNIDHDDIISSDADPKKRVFEPLEFGKKKKKNSKKKKVIIDESEDSGREEISNDGDDKANKSSHQRKKSSDNSIGLSVTVNSNNPKGKDKPNLPGNLPVTKIVLKPIIGHKESIPCVIIDDAIGGGGASRMKRVCVAVKMVGTSFDQKMKNAIPIALQHLRQPPVTYITGFHLETEEKSISDGSMKKVKHFQVFDTITIPQGTKVKTVYNSSYFTEMDEILLNARIKSDRYANDLNDMQKRVGYNLSDPIEKTFFLAHWRKCGISIKEDPTVQVAYPPNTPTIILALRTADKAYEESNKRLISNYPHGFSAYLQQQTEKRDELRLKAEKGDYNFNSYSDLIGLDPRKREMPFDIDEMSKATDKIEYISLDDTKDKGEEIERLKKRNRDIDEKASQIASAIQAKRFRR
jgi:hypothetical protein